MWATQWRGVGVGQTCFASQNNVTFSSSSTILPVNFFYCLLIPCYSPSFSEKEVEGEVAEEGRKKEDNEEKAVGRRRRVMPRMRKEKKTEGGRKISFLFSPSSTNLFLPVAYCVLVVCMAFITTVRYVLGHYSTLFPFCTFTCMYLRSNMYAFTFVWQ